MIDLRPHPEYIGKKDYGDKVIYFPSECWEVVPHHEWVQEPVSIAQGPNGSRLVLHSKGHSIHLPKEYRWKLVGGGYGLRVEHKE